MQELKNLSYEYIQKVCNQIRWKKVHDNISEELLNHIEDQKFAFMAMGQNENEAEKNAISQMGDAVIIGQQLDRTHRPKAEWGIFLLVVICILIGLVAQYIISANSLKNGWSSKEYFWDYLKVLPLGISLMLGAYYADYSIIGKYHKIIYGAVLSFCILLFSVNSFHIYGTYRHVFYFSLILITLFAGITYSQRNRGFSGIIYCGVIGIITNAVFAYASSILSVFIFTFSAGMILTAAISRNWFKTKKKQGLLLVWLPIASLFLCVFYYSRDRLEVLFNSNENSAYRWVLLTIRNILKESHFIGQGDLPLENSTMIEKSLPLWYNDYSFVYFIHKFGWIVGLATVILVVFLILRLFLVVRKQRSELGFIVALAVALTISFQCVIFLLCNLGGVASGGCPLPILSPGRMSFLLNMLLLGLLLSTYRNNEVVRDPFKTNREKGLLEEVKNLFSSIRIGNWELSFKKVNRQRKNF